MNENKINDLIVFLGTQKRLLSFCRRVDDLVTEQISEHIDTNKIGHVFSENEIELMSALDVKRLSELALLRDRIRATPVVNLYLAFQPSIQFTEEILVFFRERIKSGHVVNITIDESLIAGAVIEFKGRHFDFSWLKFIREGRV